MRVLLKIVLGLGLVAGLSAGSCDKKDETESTMDSMEEKADDAMDSMEDGVEDMGDAVEESTD